MKIAISGPANSGKTTLLKQFLNVWPMYVSPSKSYRDGLKEHNMGHSKNTSEDTQNFIIDFMIKQMEEFKNQNNIIFDRCPLDVFVYTIQAFAHNKVSEEFVSEMQEKFKKAIIDYDAIFVLPYNPNIKIEDNGVRETDLEYILETDTIFKNIMDDYYNNYDEHILFPENCPGIIMLDSDDKIRDIQAVINAEGNFYDIKDDKILQQSFIDAVALEKQKVSMMKKLIETEESMLPKINVSGLKI